MKKVFKFLKNRWYNIRESSFFKKSDDGEKIFVTLILYNRNKPEMEDIYLDKLGEQLPEAKLHYSFEDYKTKYGPDNATLEVIESFAKGNNLEVTKKDCSIRLVTLKGKKSDFSRAFSVILEDIYPIKYHFELHYGKFEIPVALAGIVEGILGLNKVSTITAKGSKLFNFNDLPDVSLEEAAKRYSPQQIAKWYNFPETTGKGQSVAIIALGGGYLLEDIEYFLKEVEKVNMPTITDISILGATNDPGKNDEWDLEIYMDLEIIGSIANEAEINVYFAPNTDQGVIEAFNAAIFDPNRKNSVISMSWGQTERKCKPSFVKELNSLFKEAALFGITICLPSGDSGSGDSSGKGNAHVEFPSSSPYVLCCGGTQLIVEDDKIKKEVAWKEYAFNRVWATGGGVSDIFGVVPSYQKKAGIELVSVNSPRNKGRAVPDVASIAGSPGYGLYINKKPSRLAGGDTSSCAPLWAALIALLNENLGYRIGYFNPLLYKMADNHLALNDITTGNNINSDSGGYHAQSGWDACTGWGSPNGEELLKLFKGET